MSGKEGVASIGLLNVAPEFTRVESEIRRSPQPGEGAHRIFDDVWTAQLRGHLGTSHGTRRGLVLKVWIRSTLSLPTRRATGGQVGTRGVGKEDRNTIAMLGNQIPQRARAIQICVHEVQLAVFGVAIFMLEVIGPTLETSIEPWFEAEAGMIEE